MIILQNKRNNEDKDLYFNCWYRKDRNNLLQSYHTVMPSRGKMFQLYEGYYPGINSLEMPPWFDGKVSPEVWKVSLRKFNETLYNWWRPGDRVRNYTLFVSWLFLPLMCCICALDETAVRKKKQCIHAMKSICEKLTEETPLRWSVDFRQLSEDVMVTPDLSYVSLELCVALKG